MNKFYDLRIFHPVVMGGEYVKLQKAIIEMICSVLLSKLDRDQVVFFEIKNYYIWDPNYPERGSTQSLLEHLVFDAIAEVSTLQSEGHFNSEMFLNDLKKNFGIFYYNSFINMIDEINEKWQRLALVEILDVNDNNPKISFKLISKLGT